MPSVPYKYKPEYCEMLVEHMSRGHSFYSFGFVVGVHRSCLYQWRKAHPEFKEAKQRGECAAVYYLEGAMLKGMWIHEGEPKLNKEIPLILLRNIRKWMQDETVRAKQSVTPSLSEEDVQAIARHILGSSNDD